DDTNAVCMGVEEGANGGVKAGVAQHDMLTMLERSENNPLAGFHVTGGVDDHVDVASATQKKRVFDDGNFTPRDSLIELVHRSNLPDVAQPALMERVLSLAGAPVVYGGEAHPESRLKRPQCGSAVPAAR